MKKSVSNKPCPECKVEHTVKDGFHITREGKLQRFLCCSCGHTFY